MAKKLPLDDCLNRAGQLVVRTRIFLDVWWLYEGDETRRKNIDTMNLYPSFYRFDPHAHFVSFVVHAAGLVENRSDTINLPWLVKELADSGLIAPPSAGAVKLLLPSILETGKGVTILRSNLFSHRSASLTYAETFRIAGVIPDTLPVMLDDMLKMVNLLLAARGMQEVDFYPPPVEDAAKMLADLRAFHASKKPGDDLEGFLKEPD